MPGRLTRLSTIRPDSNLSIQVVRRRVWPKNPLLADAVVDFEDAVRDMQSSHYEDDATVHRETPSTP